MKTKKTGPGKTGKSHKSRGKVKHQPHGPEVTWKHVSKLMSRKWKPMKRKAK